MCNMVCMESLNRKRGPEVGQFRWSVTGADGKRLYHKEIVGTVERYPDENAARRSVVGLLSVAQRIGIEKQFGWHTFRHTYSTLLRGVGTEFKVMQELLRHSILRSTLDVYTQAVTPAKHAAQAAVVLLAFSSSAGGGTPIGGE